MINKKHLGDLLSHGPGITQPKHAIPRGSAGKSPAMHQTEPGAHQPLLPLAEGKPDGVRAQQHQRTLQTLACRGSISDPGDGKHVLAYSCSSRGYPQGLQL